ncbi:MAG TPA: YceI family protein [Bryobacteraceae bacterium]|nr:YceI family protein [Bryobacteraceae bacterium]
MLISATWAGAASLPAQEMSFQLDPAQTKIEFTLGSTLHTVHGTFRLKHGAVHFNPINGQAGGEIVADATSGETGNSGRDRRMHQSILETARYPEIVFRPDRVSGKLATTGPSQLEVHGMFTIHGAEHEMTLSVAVQPAPGGYSAKASFTVPYHQWGIKNPSTFLLRASDKVDVTIETLAHAAH